MDPQMSEFGILGLYHVPPIRPRSPTTSGCARRLLRLFPYVLNRTHARHHLNHNQCRDDWATSCTGVETGTGEGFLSETADTGYYVRI